MRTTLTLDDDVATELERLRRDEGIGMSEAANRLIRAGILKRPAARRYRHVGANVGIKVDVGDIGAVLDLLDQV